MTSIFKSVGEIQRRSGGEMVVPGQHAYRVGWGENPLRDT